MSKNCLGLATEWIEIPPVCLTEHTYTCLGLATEWIEMNYLLHIIEWKTVSVLRPSGLK